MVEMQNEAEEDAQATLRRYDSGPVIKKWLEMLAENGFLEENLERFMPGKGKNFEFSWEMKKTQKTKTGLVVKSGEFIII
ncbi:hypothetical protein PTT_03337 [Pyrenophora teres f. teres 0-1]|uniref:Uncharacterized protein n=1 Tax=Pyrenophora teres f. teres (strain 0-1) TaxID=861557 RepID=E3RDX9_PYRTT|nr:hypothetical protein PTT_03337 [Pyrenophora teres f. teres 0-1]